MTGVLWLERRQADVPAGDEWLSAREAARLAGIRFEKRRQDWRLGRWTAKRTVAEWLRLRGSPAELALIEIRAAASGKPEAFLEGRPAGFSISISHSAGIAACALASGATALGCDLEKVEPRSGAFVRDYFTPTETTIVEQAAEGERRLLVTLIWSAKESALKALGEGLRLDTRAVEVSADASPGAAWARLQVRCRQAGRIFDGWWTAGEGFVRTIVAEPPAGAPEHELPVGTRGSTIACSRTCERCPPTSL
ncbi:MAG TPA: 4'-phosphopantetheinyl transferase superfamily protein [Bryobacteraceae bacterium]|nr:4'-phosphopantetheinyl transferase superfamily protein [Bryobacteraceae bacterium]